MNNLKQNIKFTIWISWILASVFYAYQYILRVLPNIMMDDIMQQFSLDPAIFGQFSGIYYIGYAITHIPLGILLDRYGPKRIMAACILINVLGLIPLIFATHWTLALFSRFLIGVGSSGAILSVFKIIQLSFKKEQFTRMLSFTATIGLLGAIYGAGPADYFCQLLGHQYFLAVLTIFGIILCITAYLVTPNGTVTKQDSILDSVKVVFTNYRVLAICLFAGLMIGPMEGFADAWGKQFLQLIYNFESTTSANLCATIFIGMCFGSPILSQIAAKTDELMTIAGAGIIMATCFALLLFGVSNIALISFMFILIGACSGYQILAIFKASNLVPKNAVGLSTAVVNMIMMLFGYGFHSSMGTVVSNYVDSPIIGFQYAIAIIPAALLLGTGGFIFMFWQERIQRIRSVEVAH